MSVCVPNALGEKVQCKLKLNSFKIYIRIRFGYGIKMGQ